jgi:transposase
LLFEAWEATGSVKEACEKAQVRKQTFYYWLPRFRAAGYAGLAARSRAPKNPHRTAKHIEQRVIEMKQAHGAWGKQRITDEMSKENSWVPVVSPNTVRRILRDAGLWPEPTDRGKKRGQQEQSAMPKSQDKR